MRVKIVRIDLPALFQLCHSKKTDIPVSLSDDRYTLNMAIVETEIQILINTIKTFKNILQYESR